MPLSKPHALELERPCETTGQRFVLAADLHQLSSLREDSLYFLRDAGVVGDALEAWELILTEAFVNAVRHGSRGDGCRVEVEWKLSPGMVVLEVLDSGTGVPVEMRARQLLPDNPMEEGGRGLFLIRSLSDATYHFTGESGHLLRIEKADPKFDPGEAADSLLNSTMEELSASYESLAAFYRLGEAMVQADRVSAFIVSAQVDMLKLVSVDHFSMCWYEGVEPSLLTELRRMRDSLATIPDSSVVAGAREKGGDFVFEEAAEVTGDPIFEGYESGCCIPVQSGRVALGCLNLGRLAGRAVFKAKDLNTLRTYADLFGIAVAHANNAIARTREQQALREIEIAAELQETLVPTAAPEPCPEWDLFLRRLSARSVSGDFTEAYRLPDGRLFMVIADVMGKGVSAAFFAGMMRTAIRLALELEPDLETLVHRLNHTLCLLVGDLTLFATAGFALVDKDRTRVEVANAGHCPVLLGWAGEILAVAEPSGPPLGLFPEQEYLVERFPMEKQHWLLMVTDGLYEWEIGDRQIWGWEALVKMVRETVSGGGETLWTCLQDRRHDMAQDTQLEDDQTLIFYRREL